MRLNLKNSISVALLFLSIGAWAQDGATTASGGSTSLFESTPAIIFLSFIIAFQVLLIGIIADLKRMVEKQTGKSSSMISAFTGIFKKDALTGEYADVIIDGHDYDGIQEYDNDLPPWWKYMFYLTIIFAVVYLIYYHVLDGPTQLEEYEMEVAEAAVLYKDVDIEYEGPSGEAGVLANGKALFEGATCPTCHGTALEGKVGPNLTDDSWKNGCDVNDIYKTIKYGVQGTGMQSWSKTFNNEEIYSISSYILSMKGTNPANAKQAEGEVCK